MVKYSLFGQTVVFDDPAERFYDLMHASQQASEAASDQFASWYKQCGNIEAVLDNYDEVVRIILTNLSFQPLYSQLTDYEIYDISQEIYWNRCVHYTNAAAAVQDVEQQYLSILRQHDAEKQYRQMRKDSRGRWQGGGFGLSGALKGAAQAATLNAVSGLGHSAFNAIGNAGSALSESYEKGELYRSTDVQDKLLKGIIADLTAVFGEHMTVVNERRLNHIRSAFDRNKSSALFDNAKKLPEKRLELLRQAFSLCPWNQELVRYIFVNFPNERKSMCAAANRFSVDLSVCMEDILAREYTDLARASEAEAQSAKERILRLMREYEISESATLDQLETDCLQRLCGNYESADKDTCKQLIDAINWYPAQDKLKLGFIAKIQKRIRDIWTDELNEICRDCETSDESTCEQMTEAVKNHEAEDELKERYLKKIQNRIEAIWSAEDGEIFDNLYLKTDVFDPDAITEAMAYIKSKGRTASSKKYLDALEACTPEMIKRARSYKYSKWPVIFLVLTLLALVLCFVGYAVIGIPLAVIFFLLRRRLKKAWNVLNIGGKVIHPVLAEQSATVPKTENGTESEAVSDPEEAHVPQDMSN